MSSTKGQTITCKAAIAWEAGKPLTVEDVEVAPPKAHEVRIKVLYTGICHTDAYTLSGNDPEGDFPCILGHEGGGIVESVGAGVENVEVGDHVIPLYTAECKECKMCKSGKTNLCSAVRITQGQGVMPDKTSRFRARNKDIKHYMGVSTFSQYTVVADVSVVAIDKAAELDKACLLGCGITTGYGAITKLPKIAESQVAVFGIGCVGLSILQGAREMKCTKVIAVDTNASKRALALKFGATDFVNPAELSEGQNIVEKIVEMTDGGADFTFDATGNVKVMRSALESCHKGWGESVVIGVASAGAEISTRPFQLVTGRVWRGSAFGGVKGRTELPGIVREYMKGKLEVNDFITHNRSLKDINEGFDDMHGGACIRCVVDMSQV